MHLAMNHKILSDENLRTLDPNNLTEAQKEYVRLYLNGVSTAQIATQFEVTPQAIYKELWRAMATSESVYTQLSTPQQNCVYKQFVLECKLRNIRLCDVAKELNISDSLLSNYIYEKKPLPFDVALKIQKKFFPTIPLNRLFVYNELEDVNIFPALTKAMKKKNVTNRDIANSINVPFERVSAVLGGKEQLTYQLAVLIHDKLFSEYKIETLFDSQKTRHNNL